MNIRLGKWGAGLALAAGAFLFPAAARADSAVVVGVNRYPGLKEANLAGCVNDAQAVAQNLKRYGFEVTVLTDAQATKSGIMNAVNALKSKSRAQDRVVFYFAGHGSRSSAGGSVLLPSDAKEGAEGNDLSAQALNEAIRTVPARSRTVLLDSCFSGGMMRSFNSLQRTRPRLRTRFHPRELGGGTKDLVKVNASDTPTGGSGVCYFAASSANEQAGEDDFGAERHGVFTYYLMRRLTGGKDRWGDVQSTVSGKVAEHMEDTQHPRLTPDFVNAPVFDGKDVQPEPDPKPEPHNLWDDYNGDHVDRTKVEVQMRPDQTTCRVGDHLRFTTRVGAVTRGHPQSGSTRGGYLVILERGVQDDVHILFPESAKVDDARVEGARVIDIPEPDMAYAPDAPGTERVRAILFSSKETAKALLDQFPPSRSIKRTQLLRKLVKVSTKQAPFYTSDIVFEVRPREERGE